MLAEKLETIIYRGVTNTRMRDFYDVYVLQVFPHCDFDADVLAKAIENTSKKRGTWEFMLDSRNRITDISSEVVMKELWKNYQNKFDFAQAYTWDEVVGATENLLLITGFIEKRSFEVLENSSITL